MKELFNVEVLKAKTKPLVRQPNTGDEAVLTYFEHTTEENACTPSLWELHEMVTKVKLDEEVELQHMKIFEWECSFS